MLSEREEDSETKTSEEERDEEIVSNKKQLKSTKSFHKFKNGNLTKVRSRIFPSVGGSMSSGGEDLLREFPSLQYDTLKDDKLINNAPLELRVRQMVTAKSKYISHTKEEVLRPALHRKLALRKMKLPNIPKSDTTKEFLKTCIMNNVSFSSMTDEQVNLIIQALKPRKVGKDVILLKQGDVGAAFYIVQKGELVATEKVHGQVEEREIARYNRGSSFGELALLYGTRREMSVKTMQLCCVWKLDSMSFRKILAHGEDIDYDLILDQLMLIPILAEAKVSQNEEQMRFLTQNVHFVKVKKGEVLISKGDKGDVMYFITQGAVRVTKPGKKDKSARSEESQPVDYITGDYFGEGALLKKFTAEEEVKPLKTDREKTMILGKRRNQWTRAANVFALKDCELFVLDYVPFKRLAEFNENEFVNILRQNLEIRILRASSFINKMRRQYRDFFLENLEILEYEHDDLIIQKGEIEKILFLVVDGKVELRKPNGFKAQASFQVGQSFGEQYFFDKKKYHFDLVAIGKTKIFAMTLTIFQDIFDSNLTMKDLYKTGDPNIDEEMLIDFAGLSMAGVGVNNIKAIQKCFNSNDPRHNSAVIKKISENFEIDQHNSVVKRKVTSVRAQQRVKGEDQLGEVIEKRMEMLKSDKVRKAKVKALRQSQKQSGALMKALPAEMLSKKFKVLGAIGMGSFGMVKLVRAKKKKGEKKVHYALKILDVAKVIKLGQQESVLSEKLILAQVSHPLVLKYISSFKDNQHLYIMTELLVGGELFEIIQAYRKKDEYIPDEDAIFYTACIVETFDYLHKNNILYRDIKPENIMIDASGYTRLVDFGFAKRCKFKTFTRCGTAEYFAPELLQQRGYNKSVDIWGIGILTYEIMTGMSPFYSNDYAEMVDFILHENPDFGGDFPDQAMNFIEALLQKEPNERLGMNINDPDQIKNHAFLESIDFGKLVRKEITPPWVPAKKKLKIRSEEELRMRLEQDEMSMSYDLEIKEKDLKGWFEEF